MNLRGKASCFVFLCVPVCMRACESVPDDQIVWARTGQRFEYSQKGNESANRFTNVPFTREQQEERN